VAAAIVGNVMGEQHDKIVQAEKALNCGPVQLARLLQTPYDTLKDWKSERTVMPGVAYVALELMLEKQD